MKSTPMAKMESESLSPSSPSKPISHSTTASKPKSKRE